MCDCEFELEKKGNRVVDRQSLHGIKEGATCLSARIIDSID